MKYYRIKHLPTSLYWCPSREVKITLENGKTRRVKTNLSKAGKIYTSMPSFHWIKGGIYSHLAAKEVLDQGKLLPYYHNGITIPFLKNEWLIEEVKDED